jgi:hypothetical protein
LGLIIQRHFTHHRGGRFAPERPADLDRNRWPICAGTGGRFESESVAGLGRNLHYRLFPFVIIDSNINLPLQIGSQLFCHIIVFMKKVSLIAKKKMETLTAYSLFG